MENSHGALEKYKRQFSEQVQGLRKEMEKTTLIVDGMEVTFCKRFQHHLFPFFLLDENLLQCFLEQQTTLFLD